MSLVHMNFASQYLGYYTDVNILLPNKPKDLSPASYYGSGHKYKVLYLLHGGLSDYSDWERKTMIELYARERDLVVVMPSVQNSFYTRWSYRASKWVPPVDAYGYILDELMPLVSGWYPASSAPEDTYIAGFSMGAVGTLKFVANNPGRFAGAAAFSAAPVDLRVEPATSEAENQVVQLSFANGSLEAAIAGPDNVRDKLVENKDLLPPIYCSCGTADNHYEGLYTDFKRFALDEGLPITFSETPGAGHDMRFWNQEIERALDFFGL